jgi:hypothetical protein
MPLDFVKDAHAIMWNNGTLRPIQGKFVDDSVCPVVPKVRAGGPHKTSYLACLLRAAFKQKMSSV